MISVIIVCESERERERGQMLMSIILSSSSRWIFNLIHGSAIGLLAEILAREFQQLLLFKCIKSTYQTNLILTI